MIKIKFLLILLALTSIVNVASGQIENNSNQQNIECQDSITVRKDSLQNDANYLCQNGTLVWKTVLTPKYLQWNNIPICYSSSDDGDNTLIMSANSKYVQVNNEGDWSQTYNLKNKGVIDIDLITLEGVVSSNNGNEIVDILNLQYQGTSEYLCIGSCEISCK